MSLWILALLVTSSALVFEPTSFQSPMFPEHSRKFYMLGSAIPLKNTVRVVPNSVRKSGAVIAINPIKEKNYQVVVTGTLVGRVFGEDEGGFTIWFTAMYARHITVGSFFGVSPRIQGVLLIYDYKRGFIGHEKMTEDPITNEGLPLTFQCVPPAFRDFKISVSFARGKMTVEFEKEQRRILCFEMPVTETNERFLGISAVCGYPCQRGLEIVSIQTILEVTEQLFISRMSSDNQKLEVLLTSLQSEFDSSAQSLSYLFLSSVYTSPDLPKIDSTLSQVSESLSLIAVRVTSLEQKYVGIVESEAQDTESKRFFHTLKSTIEDLEREYERLANFSANINVTKVVENYILTNNRLLASDRQIEGLTKAVQRQVAGYQRVLGNDDHFYAVFSAFCVVAGLGCYLFFRLRSAGKRLEL